MTKRQGEHEGLSYTSFILRFWLDMREQTTWRFVLVNSKTGAVKGFENLSDLVEHLDDIMSEQSNLKTLLTAC